MLFMTLCALFILYFPKWYQGRKQGLLFLIYYVCHLLFTPSSSCGPKDAQAELQRAHWEPSYSHTTAPSPWLRSQSSDFLVKRQRHNWSSVFTSHWLSGDPYPHLHAAIWILMKVNGIISISKCVWYTEGGKKEKRLLCITYTQKKVFGRGQKGKVSK